MTGVRGGGGELNKSSPEVNFFSAYHLTAAIPPRQSGRDAPPTFTAAWVWLGEWGGLDCEADDFNLRQHLGRIVFHLLIFLGSPHLLNLILSGVDEKCLFP